MTRWNSPGEQAKLLLYGKHTSIAGKYLGAVVWYQTLFNTDTVPVDFVPRGLTAEDTANFRVHAAEAVKAERLRGGGVGGKVSGLREVGS